MQKTFIFLLLALPILAQAQTDPPLVASGSYQNDSYQWSFAVGDLAILTLQSTANVWSQGSIQPDLGIVPVHQANLPDVTIQLYPNPTADVLYCQITAPASVKDLQMDVFDTNGRVVLDYSILVTNREQTRISLASLPAGHYFLRFTDVQGRWMTHSFQKI